MTETLRPVLTSVEEMAASIEQAFLGAGDSLSRGLDVFGQFGTDLSSFAQDFDGGGVSEASAALESLSRELIEISKAMPEDGATLKELTDANTVISRRLADLVENSRMMATLARSARIEAVAFTDGSGLEAFTQDIATLTNAVQRDVTACAVEHAQLAETLRLVSKAQMQLDRTYRDRLLSLAKDLSETFEAVQEKQRASLDLMQDVGARSSEIAQSAGMALVALQAGDSTRQRLEHVAFGVEAALALHEGRDLPGLAVPDDLKASVAAASCLLQRAQLEDSITGFRLEMRDIDNALGALITDTRTMLARSRTTFGGQSSGSESFLSGFRAQLAAAADLLRTCEASRRSVERTSVDLRTKLGELHQGISTFNTVTVDLTLVGLNAGLKAIRLGSRGRSFIVIADELKRLADLIFKDSRELLAIFLQTQDIVIRLGRSGHAPDRERIEVDVKIAAIVDGFAAGDGRAADFLSAFQAKADNFDTELTRARALFAGAEAMNTAALESAETLGLAAEGHEHNGIERGSSYLDALMTPKYTMAREREIHADVLGTTDPAETGVAEEELW